MGVTPQRTESFAYLFERFPSFTQTFCFREVLALRQLGIDAPVFSIRVPRDEPRQDFPPELAGITTYLPESYDGLLSDDAGFRRRARGGISELERAWGSTSEKRRIYESEWLARELDRRGVGHVHCHFAGVAARTAYWLHRRHGLKYSFTAHANDIFCDEPTERLGQLVRAAEAVVTVSDYSVAYLRKLFPDAASKIQRVYNGIHVERFTPAHPDREKPLVVSVGRYIEKKGFADLISACGQLREENFVCQIVGEGPLEATLRAQVASEGLADRVKISGPMAGGEIAELLSRASVFALPCVDLPGGAKDNLPTVIMEAMAASLPVISTPVAGVPEMVIDGKTGFLVPERDPDSLAARLLQLLLNPGEAASMGAAGRSLCEERFAAERTTAALRDVLATCGAFQPARRGWLDGIFRRP